MVQESPEARSLELDVPAGLAGSFSYAPGQFVTVELPWEGFAIRRCYSLSSAPGIDAAPTFTVKRVPGGRASNWLNERVAVGDTLRVSLPDGRFVLHDADATRPLVLFAAGSGITPILSLTKAALHGSDRSVALFYANRDAASVIFREPLDDLAQRFAGRLTVRHHLDSQAGVATADHLRDFVAGLVEGVHYVCGPAPFMDAVEDVLLAEGVPAERTHFERFVSPIDPDRQTPGDRVSHLPSMDIEAFGLTLDGTRHEVPYRAGQTLLAAAQAAGLQVPSSCESGYCGSCMAQCETGNVAMATHEALGERSLQRGRILLCQAKPVSREPLQVSCDATSFRIEPEGGAAAPWLRRLVGAAVAAFVFAAVWVLRTRS